MRVESLDLRHNNFRDRSLSRLGEAAVAGAFPRCETLRVCNNRDTELLVERFARYLHQGAFPQVKSLWLGSSELSIERAVAVDLKEACLQRSLLCTIQAEYDEKVAHDASRLKFGLALMADVLEPQQPAAADPASDEVTPELHPVL